MHVSQNKRTAKNWHSAGEGRDSAEVGDQEEKSVLSLRDWRAEGSQQHGNVWLQNIRQEEKTSLSLITKTAEEKINNLLLAIHLKA